MKSTQIIALTILGSLALSPVLALGEETSAAAGAGTETTVSSGDGSATTNTGASGSATTERESPSKSSTGKVEFTHEVKSPRDAASGQATGRRLNGLPPGTPVMGTHIMASGTKPFPAGMEMRNKMMASGTKPLPPGMEQRMENRDERHTEMTDKREQMQEKHQEHRGEVLKHQAMQLTKIAKAAIERYTKLIERINSRIAKLKAEGKDTTKAEASVAIAVAKLSDAKAAVALAESSLQSAALQADASASSSVKIDSGKPVRDAIKKAREALNAVQQALMDAVTALRPLAAEVRTEGEGKNLPPKPEETNGIILQNNANAGAGATTGQ